MIKVLHFYKKTCSTNSHIYKIKLKISNLPRNKHCCIKKPIINKLFEILIISSYNIIYVLIKKLAFRTTKREKLTTTLLYLKHSQLANFLH